MLENEMKWKKREVEYDDDDDGVVDDDNDDFGIQNIESIGVKGAHVYPVCRCCQWERERERER